MDCKDPDCKTTIEHQMIVHLKVSKQLGNQKVSKMPFVGMCFDCVRYNKKFK